MIWERQKKGKKKEKEEQLILQQTYSKTRPLPKLHPRGGSILRIKSPCENIKGFIYCASSSASSYGLDVVKVCARHGCKKLKKILKICISQPYLVIEWDHEIAINRSTVRLILQGALLSVQPYLKNERT